MVTHSFSEKKKKYANLLDTGKKTRYNKKRI
jgi:hypothetical protein